MLWLLLGLVAALSLSGADALSKKALGDSEVLLVAWARQGLSLPFLLPGLFLINWPGLDAVFWLALAFLVPLEILALLLYVKAIKVSPLSLTIPFTAASPVFIILFAFVLLGEVPGPVAAAGIVLVVAGGYLMNAGASREGVLGPIRALRREPGSVMMLAVAFIYAITSTLGKVAVLHSGPVFFGLVYPPVITFFLTPILWLKGQHVAGVAKRPLIFLPLGLLMAVMVLAHFSGIALTEVAYLISIKRTSLIFSVLLGRFLFQETNLGARLLGGSVMALGAALIVAGSGL